MKIKFQLNLNSTIVYIELKFLIEDIRVKMIVFRICQRHLFVEAHPKIELILLFKPLFPASFAAQSNANLLHRSSTLE